MSGWIKFWKDTNDDPRLMEAARQIADSYVFAQRTPAGGNDLSPGDALRFASNALRGALTALWCYADEHVRNDDTLPINSQTLDAMIGLDGFCAMLPTDWIEVMDNGTVKLPGYCAKNQLIAKEKRRADGKTRQARYRARHAGINNGSHTHTVTSELRVTKCVDRDSDLDQDLRKEAEGNRAPRSARIDPMFGMTPERREYAEKRGLNPIGVMEAFVDYWTAAPGERGRKNDWDATWRTWCRKEASQAKPASTKPTNLDHDSLEWREATHLAEAIGFRKPWPMESAGSYLTAVKFETNKPMAREVKERMAALTNRMRMPT